MEDLVRKYYLFRFIAALSVWTVFAFFKALEDVSRVAIAIVCFVGTFPFIAFFLWLLDRRMKAAEQKKGGSTQVRRSRRRRTRFANSLLILPLANRTNPRSVDELVFGVAPPRRRVAGAGEGP